MTPRALDFFTPRHEPTVAQSTPHSSRGAPEELERPTVPMERLIARFAARVERGSPPRHGSHAAGFEEQLLSLQNELEGVQSRVRSANSIVAASLDGENHVVQLRQGAESKALVGAVSPQEGEIEALQGRVVPET